MIFPETGTLPSTLIIYCQFTLIDGIFGVRPLKEKFIIGDKVYEISDVYGMDKIGDKTECVACLTNETNTIIKPCNHICLCSKCVEILIKSNQLCPICRSRNVSIIY